ncbi:MAG: DUF2851 family protein [Flavobacteriales bacterium]|nr:DUF2851 family protein [Flavobacteriales bacterium]
MSRAPCRSGHGPSGTSGLLLDPEFPYGEELLQFIWEKSMYEPHALRTTDGRTVDVIHPGLIQPNSGPDLSGALVRVDGQLWAGTVEVHIRSSEWDVHGHQYDPAYENVVLHVVYVHDKEVRTQQGTLLPTLELINRLPLERAHTYHGLMRGKDFIPCAEHIGKVGPKMIRYRLQEVLEQRFLRKGEAVERIQERTRGNVEETLYRLLAMGFGMRVNAEPFGMLAEALPLKIVKRYRDDPERVEALVFGQAGMLQVDLVDDFPRRLQADHAVLGMLHGLRPAPVGAWKFGRMRPANFPTIRLAQFAQFLVRCDGSFGKVLQLVDVEDLRDLLDVEASPYWNTHHRFDHPGTFRPKRLGTMAADHIIINTIVPALHALGRIHGRPALVRRALEILEQLPAEHNAVLEKWSGLGLRADSAADGQALLELRGSHCGQRHCLSCVIGMELLRNPR